MQLASPSPAASQRCQNELINSPGYGNNNVSLLRKVTKKLPSDKSYIPDDSFSSEKCFVSQELFSPIDSDFYDTDNEPNRTFSNHDHIHSHEHSKPAKSPTAPPAATEDNPDSIYLNIIYINKIVFVEPLLAFRSFTFRINWILNESQASSKLLHFDGHINNYTDNENSEAFSSGISVQWPVYIESSRITSSQQDINNNLYLCVTYQDKNEPLAIADFRLSSLAASKGFKPHTLQLLTTKGVFGYVQIYLKQIPRYLLIARQIFLRTHKPELSPVVASFVNPSTDDQVAQMESRIHSDVERVKNGKFSNFSKKGRRDCCSSSPESSAAAVAPQLLTQKRKNEEFCLSNEEENVFASKEQVNAKANDFFLKDSRPPLTHEETTRRTEHQAERQLSMVKQNKPENKPETKPETKSETKSETKPETRPETRPENKPENESENKLENEPENEPEAFSTHDEEKQKKKLQTNYEIDKHADYETGDSTDSLYDHSLTKQILFLRDYLEKKLFSQDGGLCSDKKQDKTVVETIYHAVSLCLTLCKTFNWPLHVQDSVKEYMTAITQTMRELEVHLQKTESKNQLLLGGSGGQNSSEDLMSTQNAYYLSPNTDEDDTSPYLVAEENICDENVRDENNHGYLKSPSKERNPVPLRKSLVSEKPAAITDSNHETKPIIAPENAENKNNFAVQRRSSYLNSIDVMSPADSDHFRVKHSNLPTSSDLHSHRKNNTPPLLVNGEETSDSPIFSLPKECDNEKTNPLVVSHQWRKNEKENQQNHTALAFVRKKSQITKDDSPLIASQDSSFLQPTQQLTQLLDDTNADSFFPSSNETFNKKSLAAASDNRFNDSRVNTAVIHEEQEQKDTVFEKRHGTFAAPDFGGGAVSTEGDYNVKSNSATSFLKDPCISHRNEKRVSNNTSASGSLTLQPPNSLLSKIQQKFILYDEAVDNKFLTMTHLNNENSKKTIESFNRENSSISSNNLNIKRDNTVNMSSKKNTATESSSKGFNDSNHEVPSLGRDSAFQEKNSYYLKSWQEQQPKFHEHNLKPNVTSHSFEPDDNELIQGLAILKSKKKKLFSDYEMNNGRKQLFTAATEDRSFDDNDEYGEEDNKNKKTNTVFSFPCAERKNFENGSSPQTLISKTSGDKVIKDNKTNECLELTQPLYTGHSQNDHYLREQESNDNLTSACNKTFDTFKRRMEFERQRRFSFLLSKPKKTCLVGSSTTKPTTITDPQETQNNSSRHRDSCDCTKEECQEKTRTTKTYKPHNVVENVRDEKKNGIYNNLTDKRKQETYSYRTTNENECHGLQQLNSGGGDNGFERSIFSLRNNEESDADAQGRLNRLFSVPKSSSFDSKGESLTIEHNNQQAVTAAADEEEKEVLLNPPKKKSLTNSRSIIDFNSQQDRNIMNFKVDTRPKTNTSLLSQNSEENSYGNFLKQEVEERNDQSGIENLLLQKQKLLENTNKNMSEEKSSSFFSSNNIESKKNDWGKNQAVVYRYRLSSSGNERDSHESCDQVTSAITTNSSTQNDTSDNVSNSQFNSLELRHQQHQQNSIDSLSSLDQGSVIRDSCSTVPKHKNSIQKKPNNNQPVSLPICMPPGFSLSRRLSSVSQAASSIRQNRKGVSGGFSQIPNHSTTSIPYLYEPSGTGYPRCPPSPIKGFSNGCLPSFELPNPLLTSHSESYVSNECDTEEAVDSQRAPASVRRRSPKSPLSQRLPLVPLPTPAPPLPRRASPSITASDFRKPSVQRLVDWRSTQETA